MNLFKDRIVIMSLIVPMAKSMYTTRLGKWAVTMSSRPIMFSNIMIKFKFAKKYNYSNKNARKVLQMLLDILNNVHRLTEYKSFDSVKTKFDEIQKEFE